MTTYLKDFSDRPHTKNCVENSCEMM